MSARRFRKKPVEITAVQWTGSNTAEVADFMGGSPTFGSTDVDGHYVVLTTVHGEQALARPGDWVIPEPTPGRFYPCKPDIFTATYEEITSG